MTNVTNVNFIMFLDFCGLPTVPGPAFIGKEWQALLPMVDEIMANRDLLDAFSTFFNWALHSRTLEKKRNEENYNIPLSELGLTVRTANLLRTVCINDGFENSIFYLGDLVQLSRRSLLKEPGLGIKSMEQIHAVLMVYGLKLEMKIEGWTRPQSTKGKENE